jgi:pyridoxal phosphate enzyme (YggS family)
MTEKAIATIRDNLALVEERIEAACRRSGRRREDVRLIAVSKTHPVAAIREAFAAGVRDFGENRVQEAKAKVTELAGLPVTWHMIGHLQSNKARVARELFDWVHSVDSASLAEKLSGEEATSGRRLPVMIEVNLAAEASKGGTPPEQLEGLARKIASLPNLELRGVMAIPPYVDDPEDARPYFTRLRKLAEELEGRNIPGVSTRELSMGMSHDFEVAIEEGATMVRVGTAIFGER